MGVLDDARRRTGQFLREHEGLIDKATGRAKAAAGGVLERAGARGADRAPTPRAPARAPRPSTPRAPSTPSSGQGAARPPRRSRAGGPSVSRVREQAERLEAGVSRVGNETAVEQLVRQNTKAELMGRAHELGIKGRSRMTKRQLAEEIDARE